MNTALQSPGASAVIYGGVEAKGVAFDGVADALQVPQTDIRLSFASAFIPTTIGTYKTSSGVVFSNNRFDILLFPTFRERSHRANLALLKRHLGKAAQLAAMQLVHALGA